MTTADAEYAAGRYLVALQLYEGQAAEGDVIAAEMAGYMLFFGPELFGRDVPCDPGRARHFLHAAAERGRLVARMLLHRLERNDPFNQLTRFNPLTGEPHAEKAVDMHAAGRNAGLLGRGADPARPHD